jgi:Uma2 family endonuclease
MTLTEASPTKTYTPDELASMPDGKRFELVGGHLVERKMGNESSLIGGRIYVILFAFVSTHRLGKLFPADAGFQCFADDRDRVRRPDVSFVRAGRLPGDRPSRGFDRIAPALVVEVVSPGDTAEEVQEKVHEHLGAGVRLVWVVYPSTRTLRVHRPRSATAGSGSDLSEDDVITGEDVLPGFSCPVGEFFDDAPVG